MIPYGRQNISEKDIQAVVDVLRSDYLTQGPTVEIFENTICEYTGANYGVAVNSATSALHIACLALGLGKGDYLWTTPITFVASANCGLYCHAKIDFVDIDPNTQNLSIERLHEKLIDAKKSGCLPKVLVAVHLCGLSCDMKAIHALSKKFNFCVIEDASHAIGGRYLGNLIGSCAYSDITVFSFHPVKTITTGEGGMAMTNDQELAEKMDLYRSHGITRDPMKMTHKPDGGWYYQQIDLGFNYRMTDMQAALGISQINRLDEFVAKRHEIAKYYDKQLNKSPLRLPMFEKKGFYSGLHLYVVRVIKEKTKSTHRQIFNRLRKYGIGVNLHYIPVHTQPYYQRMGFKEGDYPVAEDYYHEAISLPMYPDLSSSEQNQVIFALTTSLV